MLQSYPPPFGKNKFTLVHFKKFRQKNSTSIEVLPLYRMSWKNYFFFAYL